MWMTNLTVTSMTNSSITNSPTEFYNLFAEITNGLLQPNSTSSESATSISLSMPTTKPVYPMIEINISIDQYRETRNPCVGIHLESPTEQIPLVYIILNYKLSFILKTIPFICQFHDKIVLLTNSQFDSFWKSTCVEVVDISNLYDIADKEFNFPPGAAHGQKIFFTRWYVLRRWMDATGTNQIFTLDSDGLIFRNITSLVRANADVFCRSALWLIYQPPRTSMQFFLITLPALADVTDFWKRMLQPDIWSSEYVEGTSPNDMIAMGHYIHAAIGRPYPCWGLNRENPAYLSSPGTCDNYNAYAWTKILDRLSEKKVLAAFKPETLTLYPNGSPNGSMGGGAARGGGPQLRARRCGHVPDDREPPLEDGEVQGDSVPRRRAADAAGERRMGRPVRAGPGGLPGGVRGQPHTARQREGRLRLQRWTLLRHVLTALRTMTAGRRRRDSRREHWRSSGRPGASVADAKQPKQIRG